MVKQMEDRHSIWIRIFHWTNMIAITMLCLTGYYIHAPESFRLFANMDNARMIHFGMAYLLCVGVLGRVYYAILADDAKNIVFSVTKDTPKFPSMMKYYLFMALIQIITGFVLYKPNMFMAVSGWLGGYMAVRVIHYIVTWLFVLSVLAHVYLDISEGVPVLKSMFTGKIPADFDHGTHEEHAPAPGESIGA